MVRDSTTIKREADLNQVAMLNTIKLLSMSTVTANSINSE